MLYTVNSPGSSIVSIPGFMAPGDNLRFNNTSVGVMGTIINWTVPASGMYQIEAWGAEGGSSSSYGSGGAGARMRGVFNFLAGETIKILVGQKGGNDSAGGGGGGTFVVSSNNTPLIIAGGGGGRSVYSSPFGTMGATTSSTGQNSSSSTARGGTSGLGGQSQNQHSGGGGGGLSGDGYSIPAVNSYWGEGGRSFLNGGRGGGTYYVYANGIGGFGGGGRSGHNGGGGGGYSGGAGGYHSSQGSGGGGSFNSGTDQDNSSAIWRNHGKVEISVISLYDTDLKISELSISKSYISGMLNEALLLKTRIDHRKGTAESIEFLVEINGTVFREYSPVLPFSLDLYIPTQLLVLPHNEIAVTVKMSSGMAGEIHTINVYKEGRDSFSIIREMRYDSSHPVFGNATRIPIYGYGIGGEGAGETIVSIPTAGKSKIASIKTAESGGYDRIAERGLAIASVTGVGNGFVTESEVIYTGGLRKITNLTYRINQP